MLVLLITNAIGSPTQVALFKPYNYAIDVAVNPEFE